MKGSFISNVFPFLEVPTLVFSETDMNLRRNEPYNPVKDLEKYQGKRLEIVQKQRALKRRKR